MLSGSTVAPNTAVLCSNAGHHLLCMRLVSCVHILWDLHFIFYDIFYEHALGGFYLFFQAENVRVCCLFCSTLLNEYLLGVLEC